MANIFISHSSKDKAFVRRVAVDLRRLGHSVWLDEWQIGLGDSIVSKLQHGIEVADFLILVLSAHSVASSWVEHEWQAKYWDEVKERRIRILPVLLNDCKIPYLLRGKKYADFRGDDKYVTGFAELSQRVHSIQDKSGLRGFYSDFVDVDCWQGLFESSTMLDLVLMYAATWRNTYLKAVKRLLSNHGRLRVVLPEAPAKSPLLHVYADKLSMDAEELKRKVYLAVKEFRDLSRHGHVEVYCSRRYFTHAMYLFDTAGILALYSYSHERIATPAFVVEDGELITFLRNDFEWLISNDPRTRCVFSSARKAHGRRKRVRQSGI